MSHWLARTNWKQRWRELYNSSNYQSIPLEVACIFLTSKRKQWYQCAWLFSGAVRDLFWGQWGYLPSVLSFSKCYLPSLQLYKVVLYKAYTNLKMKMAALSKSAGGNKERRLEVFWCIAIPICYHSRPIAKKCKRQYGKTLRSVSVYCNPHLLSFKTPENCGRWIQFQTSQFLVWSYTTMINEWEIKIDNCYLIKKI